MKSDRFKPIEFEDKEVFDEILSLDPPVVSELTFTTSLDRRQE